MRCKLGIHKILQYQLWYYAPETYCTRCETYGVHSLRQRYGDWAALHTMHPLAWPIVLWWSYRIWREERRAK